MTDFSSENNFDGDYEDSEEAIWNEFNWQKYIGKNKQDIALFLNLYQQVRQGILEWDGIAKHMGWTIEMPEPDFKPSEIEGEAIFFEMSSESFDIEDVEPYTIHKHPVYIITEGLVCYIQNNFEMFMKTSPQQASTVLSWDFLKCLNEGQKNVLLGLHAIELADYALTISHLKYSLSELNRALSVLNQIKVKHSKFLENVRLALFDLRDTYLKVISDSRDYISPDFDQ